VECIGTGRVEGQPFAAEAVRHESEAGSLDTVRGPAEGLDLDPSVWPPAQAGGQTAEGTAPAVGGQQAGAVDDISFQNRPEAGPVRSQQFVPGHLESTGHRSGDGVAVEFGRQSAALAAQQEVRASPGGRDRADGGQFGGEGGVPAYRDVVAAGEFRALFCGRATAAAAATIQMLALAVLVYARTGSPFLAALAYAAGSLPQVLGAMTLMAVADRMPPRRLLAGWQLSRALAVALLAADVLPVWAALVLLMAGGVGDGVVGGAGYALLTDVLPGRYVLGRSILNVADGAMQVAGYAAGGALLAALGPRQALWTAAGLTALSAPCSAAACGSEPPAARAGAIAPSARPGVTTRPCSATRTPGGYCWPSGCPTG